VPSGLVWPYTVIKIYRYINIYISTTLPSTPSKLEILSFEETFSLSFIDLSTSCPFSNFTDTLLSEELCNYLKTVFGPLPFRVL
jgi:hypothetical protein